MPNCTPGHADECASSVAAKCECQCGGDKHGLLWRPYDDAALGVIGKSQGWVYLLHFEPRYKRAQHYLGFTQGDVGDRIRLHIVGKGSPLVYAASRSGCAVYLGNAWRGGRRLESELKRRKNAAKLCSNCQRRGRYYEHRFYR